MVRRALMGGIVAILAIVGTLGMSYSAGANSGSRQHAQKLAKALKECKKDESKSKRKKCEKTAKAKFTSKTEIGGHKGTETGTVTTNGNRGRPQGTREPTNSLTLHIVYHVEELPQLNYSLSCNPTSGTVIDPAAACAEISRNGSMLGSPPPEEAHSCLPGGPRSK